ncbi:hypothetical protein AAFN75_17655 [Algibacter sp. AS12]|uniref:hypothetical protein n=1 Tax=Algibacter sp. AS12 TaxID=3135773 RepID=UPI00398A7329
MIKIPHNRAIELLEKRLSDLYSADVKAWQNRTLIDLQAIFGRGSSQANAIMLQSTLHYNDLDKIAEIKRTFRETLQGYIEYIKDFHIIGKEQIELSEQEFKEKYSDLLTKWNNLVPEYNQLLEDQEKLHKDYNTALNEINILEDKLAQKDNIGESIKILFLGASPINEDRLRIDEEVRNIENGLKLASLRDRFELKSEWAVTTKTLQQAMLDEKPTIVQFSGHGHNGGIALEDSLGNSKLIDNNALGSLFELFSDKVQCVFLNSCYSESQAREISKHIPYVIGMKDSVPDATAIAFSVGFYAALGAGKDIEFAYKLGLVGIKLEGIGGSDIPILLG